MKALAFKCRKVHPDGAGIEELLPWAYAYETSNSYVVFFTGPKHYWRMDDLPFVETYSKAKSIRKWIKETYNPEKIQRCKLDVGHTVKGVWRPGIFKESDILKSLETDLESIRQSEQSLALIVEKLDEVLQFIEPDIKTLETYGHKNRELLILACTEVENYWQEFMRIANKTKKGMTTKDYVSLKKPLFLDDYKIALPRYSAVGQIRPFSGWKQNAPTKSLHWYDAYNSVKHDRKSNFHQATLRACIEAVVACLVLFTVRNGPFRLFKANTNLSSRCNTLFSLDTSNIDPTTFYVPMVQTKENVAADGLFIEQLSKRILPRSIIPLSIP